MFEIYKSIDYVIIDGNTQPIKGEDLSSIDYSDGLWDIVYKNGKHIVTTEIVTVYYTALKEE